MTSHTDECILCRSGFTTPSHDEPPQTEIGRPFSPTDLDHDLIAHLGHHARYDEHRSTGRIANVTEDGLVTLVNDSDVVVAVVPAADVVCSPLVEYVVAPRSDDGYAVVRVTEHHGEFHEVRVGMQQTVPAAFDLVARLTRGLAEFRA